MADTDSAKLILFDVDGTLVLSGGAGVRAMNRAFEALGGVGDAFAGVRMAGRTDQAIVLDVLSRLGLSLDESWHRRFRETYFACLREEIEHPAPEKRMMPGIRPLLDALVARDDVWMGLLTGNFEEGARIKLAHFDLAGYFAWGAFAEDSADRNALVPIALARAAEQGAPGFARDRVFVVGDTPLDVACARAAGVRAIAVATGPYDTGTLRASGADAVFADLSDGAAFLQAIAGRGPDNS
jgi:phosphoglycolate phosphatase